MRVSGRGRRPVVSGDHGRAATCSRLLRLSLLLLACSDGVSPGLAAEGAISAERYHRAERFLSWNIQDSVRNTDIQHHWIGGEDRFWYLRTSAKNGREFLVVDAANGKVAPAFDHKLVAGGLSKATHALVEARSLPFSVFRFTPDRKAIEFRMPDRLFRCQMHSAHCEALPEGAREDEAPSPDLKWGVSLQDHNLHVRLIAGAVNLSLTTDGVEHFDYASQPGSDLHTVSDLRHPKSRPPQVIWSPSSRFIVSYRLDERAVKDMFLVQSVPEDGSARPKLFSYRYSLPGDESIARLQPVIFDVATHKRVDVEGAPLAAVFLTPIDRRYVWWAADSTRVYFLDVDRFWKSIALKSADPTTGKVREILQETSNTFLMPSDGGIHGGIYGNPTVRTLANGDVIWYSERDGWGHLYYYDGVSGKLRNRITQGDWVVRNIVRVDEKAQQVYFIASGRESGRNPYFRHLYRASLDGSGLELLTPEDADHHVPTPEDPVTTFGPDADSLSTDGEKSGFSESGRYFVDSYSRPDMPAVWVLRTRSGRLVKQLETADITGLRSGGYTPVEPFRVTAADGKTAIYGNLYRPTDFDPTKKYPVLDSIYPGPQVTRTYQDFSGATFDPVGFGHAAAVAELGFIVVTVDGRGTPHRSKAFLDDCYGRMSKAGNLDDHIAAIQQLGRRYPFMDLERVGIYGVSGGGYASTHAILTHPEFYKVAVSAEGNHDQLGYQSGWAEIYNGPVGTGDYLNAANPPFASNLRGKLLLMHGEMDDNVSPTLTMKVVDALIRANKDFDLLIIPNGNHNIGGSAYFIRREWDYLVRNLLGRDPPVSYQINEPSWVAARRD